MMESARSESTALLFLSPLFIATTVDNLDLVKRLIAEGANPLDKDENENTLLHCAALMGRLEILKYLIEEMGCNPAIEGYRGTSVIHEAAVNGHIHVVKYLVEQPECKLDPSVWDDDKFTPLTYACANGDIAMIAYLIGNMEDMKKEDIFYHNYATDSTSLHSPLCIASFKGRLSAVKYLIEECDCDPSRAEGGDGSKVPLTAAVCGGQLHVVKYLIETQHVKDQSIDKLLHTAVEVQHPEMVEYLTKALNYSPSEHKGSTLLHKAAIVGDLRIMRHFIDDHSCNPSALSRDGATPLFFAIDNGHLPVVRYLTLELKCDPLHVSSRSGPFSTGLHYAALMGQINIVEFFVNELKCDINNIIKEGKYDITPFHCAVKSGNLELVKCFVDNFGCELLSRDSMRRTTLHHAACYGQLPVLKYLIEDKKCDPYDTDMGGMNCLHFSASEGHLHVVQYLIGELRMDKDSYNNTPLNAAAMAGHLHVVSYLLKEGSKYVDGNSLTPLHLAAGQGHLDIVKYLMNSYADMYFLNPTTPLLAAGMHLNVVKYFLEEKLVTPDGKEKNRLVHEAAYFGHFDIIKYLVREMKCDPFMPLQVCCGAGHLDIVRFLIEEMNAEPDSPGCCGMMPIHCAALGGHLNVIKYLIEEQKCNINRNFILNSTPLHLAAAQGHLNVIHYLIEKNANPLCRDSTGNTPLHFAACGNHFEVVKFFVSIVNPWIVNNSNSTPLHMALLIRSDITSTALYLIVKMFWSRQ